MAAPTQTYASHTRWHPPFHFFLVPVMLINFIWSVVLCYQYPGWTQCWLVVVSLGLIVMMFLVRLNSLRVQDRLIRLEEQLRCQRILPTELAQKTGGLRVGQYIALRFAADDELESLVTEVVEGRLTKPSEIKRAIKNWRGDYFREFKWHGRAGSPAGQPRWGARPRGSRARCACHHERSCDNFRTKESFNHPNR